MNTGWRWTWAVTAIVLVVAIAIGVSVVAVSYALPLDQTTLVIDGERVNLPAVSGWQATLALTLALLAVLLASLIAIAIGIAAAALGVAVAAIVVTLTMLLLASPVLLIGWLIWLLARRPFEAGAGRRRRPGLRRSGDGAPVPPEPASAEQPRQQLHQGNAEPALQHRPLPVEADVVDRRPALRADMAGGDPGDRVACHHDQHDRMEHLPGDERGDGRAPGVAHRRQPGGAVHPQDEDRRRDRRRRRQEQAGDLRQLRAAPGRGAAPARGARRSVCAIASDAATSSATTVHATASAGSRAPGGGQTSARIAT